MRNIIVWCVLCFCGTVAAATTVQDIRVWPSPEGCRLVFDLSKPSRYHVFTLNRPHRVVIDFATGRFALRAQKIPWSDTPVTRYRTAQQTDGTLRIVLDLKQAVQTKHFLLAPTKQYGHRLVLDLTRIQHSAGKSSEKDVPAVLKRRQFIVALDAGHGGEDPGAIGRHGSREKDLVLAIAKQLHQQLRAAPRIKPLLIRRGDYYIGLRKRMQMARAAHADLFVSIHADAYKDRRARGASVFVLSAHGASSEAARWLAEQENRADLIGGVSLDDKDQLLASVLLDLSQNASTEASLETANRILTEIGKMSRLHTKRVQRAGFAVLKAPDIPSILVETGFISNPEEERQLRTKRFQYAIAAAISRGIHGYLRHKPLPLAHRASDKRLTVRPGDTLSGLARRYHTSVARIMRHNGLSSSQLRIGQALRIPNKSTKNVVHE